MKKIFISILLFLFIKKISAKEIIIKGFISGLDCRIVYLYKENTNRGNVVDSVKGAKNNFLFKIVLNETGYYIIKIKDADGVLKLILDKNLKIKGAFNDFSNSKIIGSKETKIFTKYIDNARRIGRLMINESNALADFFKKGDSVSVFSTQMKLDSLSNKLLFWEMVFLKSHKSSFTALYILQRNYLRFDAKKFESYFNKLSKNLSAHSKYIFLKTKLNDRLRVSINTKAPNIYDVDFVSKKSIKLNDFIGKYVLLDFWGSWCGPCIKAIPSIRELYNLYSKDKFSIISIAYEKEENLSKLMDLINDNKMLWNHIVVRQDESEYNLVKSYSISSYPTYILIDPKGNICFRDDANFNFDAIKKTLTSQLK